MLLILWVCLAVTDFASFIYYTKDWSSVDPGAGPVFQVNTRMASEVGSGEGTTLPPQVNT